METGMDAIAAVSFDVAAATSAPPAGAGQVSVYDIADFESKFEAAAADTASPVARTEPTESAGFRGVIESLRSLNGDVELLGGEALRIASGQREMTPGDMVMLTVRCHQFLFHCEMTANVANRTSEGVQQLFRQQS